MICQRRAPATLDICPLPAAAHTKNSNIYFFISGLENAPLSHCNNGQALLSSGNAVLSSKEGRLAREDTLRSDRTNELGS